MRCHSQGYVNVTIMVVERDTVSGFCERIKRNLGAIRSYNPGTAMRLDTPLRR